MALITYDDKEALNTNPDIPEKNKITDSDMNQIKSVVNENAIVVVSTTITVPAGQTTGNNTINYPEGYTSNNTAIAFKNYDIGTGNKTDSVNLGVTVTSSDIYVVLADLNSQVSDTTYTIRVGLVKVNYGG